MLLIKKRLNFLHKQWNYTYSKISQTFHPIEYKERGEKCKADNYWNEVNHSNNMINISIIIFSLNGQDEKVF